MRENDPRLTLLGQTSYPKYMLIQASGLQV